MPVEQDADKSFEQYSWGWWKNQLATEAKHVEAWHARGDKVVERYLDESQAADLNTPAASRKYNIFWANIQIMKAALYANPPKPTVRRQFHDPKDDVARAAALMIERILLSGLNMDQSDMHTAFDLAVEDRLLPGMGQVWLRYEVETEPIEVPPPMDPMTGQPQVDPATGQPLPPTQGEQIVYENCATEYLYWKDFLWQASRTWNEVGWVAKRAWMTEKNFNARFQLPPAPEGMEETEEVNFFKMIKASAEASVSKHPELPKGFIKGKVEVWEIWCKDTNTVYWINTAYDQILDQKDDPLGLDGFYPCPKPLLATHTTKSLIPVPDYAMVQDQYMELDVLNDRIYTLTAALRVVGVYDKGNSELQHMFSGAETRMIPVDNWAMLAEKGGLKGAMDWFPVEVVANVLEKLMVQRQAVISQIYELTSISDIMRGVTSPRETAKAQTLKAQYSSVRLQLVQREVAHFVQQALRLKAEIVAKHFQPDRIAQMSNIMYTESAMFAQQAMQLIKNFKANEYRIEVAEESLSMADYNAEREMRTEYLIAVGQFLSQSGQIMEVAPQAMPYLLRMIQWASASFRGAADIESVLDEAIQLATSAPPQGPGGPDPLAVSQGKISEQDARAGAEERIANAKAKGKAIGAIVDVAKSHMVKPPPANPAAPAGNPPGMGVQ